MTNRKKEVKKRVQKLEKLESELQNFHGWAIKITRLTVIKYLCLCGFAAYISKKVEPEIVYSEESKNVREDIEKALHLMQTIHAYNIGTPEFEIEENDRSQLSDLRQPT